MPGRRLRQLSYIFPLATAVLLFLYNHFVLSPQQNTMTAPTFGDGTWADGPFALIATPKAKLGDKPESPASKLATHMALVHNTLLRGLNSIYLQAPHLSIVSESHDTPLDGFLLFCSSFAYTLRAHHDNEEAVEFPLIEELSGAPGIMKTNVEQHAAFLPGLEAFEQYVDDVKEGVKHFDGAKIRTLVDAFGPTLRQHLDDEIGTLTKLEEYGDKFDWARYHAVAHKHSKQSADRYKEVPFMMTNHDVTFEGGIHGAFPPFPGFVHKIFQWWYVPYQSAAWEFSACDSAGNPRALRYAK